MGARSALPLAAATWFGILASRGVGAAAIVPLVLAALALALLASRAPRRTAAMLLTLAAFLGGASRGAGQRVALERVRAALPADRLARIVGPVIEPPNLASDHVAVVLRTARAQGSLPAGVRVRLRLPAETRVEWGDELECLARLDPVTQVRNPGGFDPRRWMDSAGLAASGRAFTAIVLPPRGVLRLAHSTLARWRRGIEERLAGHLSPEALELTLPLMTGDRSALSPQLDAELRSAGLIHLLALSGLHVSALAAVARGLAATTGGGVGARAAAGVMAALLYTGLAGPIPSLMRASVSECWLGAARIARRAADPVQGLAITALALLIVAPGWAWDLGFQLSCAASLGLATLATPIAAACGRWRRAASPLAVTAAAQLVAAPILIAFTHGLSWPGFAANLVAVPISGLLLAAAWLAVLADAAVPGSGHVGFSACEALARALTAVTERAASWPQALIATGHEPAIPWLAGLGAALLVIAAAGPRDLESRRVAPGPLNELARGIGAWCAALAIGLAVTAREPRPAPGCAWIVALDVGQGDATALAFPDGWWLVDAGPRTPHVDAGESVVRPFLRWAAVRRLQALAVTHDDGDHTGGAAAVMRAIPVSTLLGPPQLPGVPGPLRRFAAPSLGAVARVPRRAVARGDTLHRAPRVRVVWPPNASELFRDSTERKVATRGDNAAGLVLEIEVGETRALLTADVDSLVEESLDLAAPLALLKVGHHGSASSSGATFLARIDARDAWISAGAHNVYGHPAPGALARLANARVPLSRTDRDGALWYEVGPGGVHAIDWRERDPCAEPIESGGIQTARLEPVRAPRLR